jgi:DNA gyrase subunit A
MSKKISKKQNNKKKGPEEKKEKQLPEEKQPETTQSSGAAQSPEEKQIPDNMGNVLPREIVKEMEESYLDYAVSVIVSRALPDVRDGLKPVHRRILYTMHEEGLRHNTKFRKSATVVGSCLGRYHPHGDVAVYDSLVKMAQDFSLRYPAVQGQGNFGSQDGDEASAMRYTECRLSRIGEETLRDIGKNTVDFRPNYDATREEPSVLPSPLPQLLLNGSFGIAVGMATNIPPHNVSEVLDACVYLIDNPDTTSEDLFQFIQGPDFPTGGIIYDKKSIISAYSQGKGAILTRGKTEIQEQKKDDFRIIISEIPFQVQKSDLIKEFAQLVENKKIEGIKNIRDESDREGMRIVIDLKKDAFPKKVLNFLHKYTGLQKTFHLNMLALIDGIQPKVLSLSEAITFYLNHKKEVVIRRTQYDLEKAKERVHVLEGLMIALKNIDEIIACIKKSEDRETAKKNLMKKFGLSEIQTIAILETKLQSLVKLEIEKIQKELEEIKKRIKELNLILKNPAKLKELIKSELLEMKEKYGDKRRTKVILSSPGEIGQEELIPSAETIIVLTNGGFIKRVKPSLYKIQKRGGKGIIGLDVSEEDAVDHFLTANTLDKLLFFTDSGKVFQCQTWEIPEMSRTSKGKGLLNFLEMSTNEKILDLIHYSTATEKENKYLAMATRNGVIKKTELQAFKNVRRNGLGAIKLKQGDLLCGAKIVSPGEEIILLTKKGKTIRFKEKDLRSMGRVTAGVRAIRLSKDDAVITMDVIKLKTKDEKTETDECLLIIAANGYGKRTKTEEYRLQNRGGTGIKASKVTEKTGEIIFAKILDEEKKDLLVISEKGQVMRTSINSISILGRNTSGVRIMKLNKNDKIASAVCL